MAALFGGGGLDFSDRAMRALALLNGDYAAAATISGQGQKNRLLAQKMEAEKQLAGMFAPQDVPGAPPAMTAQSIPATVPGMAPLNLPRIDAAPQARMPSIADPATIQRLLKLKAAGVDIAPVLDVMKANQADIAVGPGGEGYNKKDAGNIGRTFASPTVVGNTPININDPSTWGKPVAQLDKGMGIGPDGRVSPLPGYVDASSAITAGQEAAKAAIGNFYAGPNARAVSQAQAPFEFVNTPTPSGAPQVMSKAAAAGGVFTGQSPTEAKRAEAATQAGIDLPAVQATASQALNLIDQIKKHPGLDARTGLRSLIPAIPGTPGADFDALNAQLGGKVFLEAYTYLRGTGAISEIEGTKAENAIARLDKAQTKEGYLNALNDLRAVIADGAKRAQQKAGQGSTKPAYTRDEAIAEARRRGLM